MMIATLGALLSVLVLASVCSVAPPALAQTKADGKALASRDLDIDGVTADVIESDRKEGVLSVPVRLRNSGNKPVRLSLVDTQGYVTTYLVSGDTKYPLLQDQRGHQVATPRDGGGWLEPTIKPKGTWSW